VKQLLIALACLLIVALGAGYFYKVRLSRLAAIRQASGENATLQKLFDDARRELIAGKYDTARTAFAHLANEAQNRQPLLNWIRLHRGLAALLRGYSNQARDAFQEVEKAGLYSNKSEDAALARFFVETAHAMSAPQPVPANASASADAKEAQPFALFLYGIKDWQQSDFGNASALLEQFMKTQSAGTFAWINDYKQIAQKYLADFRLYAEWKARPRAVGNAQELTAALAEIRAIQNKMQTRGRLMEVLKEEEAALDRKKAGMPRP